MRNLKWHEWLRVVAALVLLEQAYEALVLGLLLGEHPALVIAAIGAFAAPVPVEKPSSNS